MRFIRWLQAVDRRVVYLLLVLVLSLPFVVPYRLPIYPDTYTRQVFEQIERIAQDPLERAKAVLVLSNWGPGTSGENEPQFQVILRHLLRRRLPFVLLCSVGDPVFHDAAMVSLEKAKQAEIQRAQRRREPLPAWVYGEDYLDFGYKEAPVFASQAASIIADSRNFFRQDYARKRDLTQDGSFPLLLRFHGLRGVSAVLTISAGDESKYIAGLVKSEFPDLKIGVATMGIQANDLYPYVKSGQLFGLLNSARAATEYRTLLNPDEPSTNPIDNSMSLGKALLLLLVLMGNLAYLTTRWAARRRRLAPLDPQTLRPPLPPLPRWFMWSLFAAFAVFYGGTVAYECWRDVHEGTLPRLRVGRPDDDPARTYSRFERVGPADFEREARAQADASRNPALISLVPREAERRQAKLREARVAEFCMAFLTLGVLAFLLGDNRFYRFIEAIIIGGSAAYMLDKIDKILRPDWYELIVAGLTDSTRRANVLWALLVLPGLLWYFIYSKRYRWLNQMLVAVFIGLMIGPEFKNQINLVIPQILDTIQPIWPWATDAKSGAAAFVPSRVEHLVFVLVAVLSLAYFIMFFRPKTRVGRSVVTAGRLAMMVGFGAMFGNTVNTRLSWLAPRIGVLIQDWLGKLFAS
jgi:hypothetical protein